MRFSPSELHPPARGPLESDLSGADLRRRPSVSVLVAAIGARFSPSERPHAMADALIDVELRPMPRATTKRAGPRTVAEAETAV